MNTITIEGVTLQVPEGYQAPSDKLGGFPVVKGRSTRMWGLETSAAWHIHAHCGCNATFLRNINSIIVAGSKAPLIQGLRSMRAIKWFLALESK